MKKIIVLGIICAVLAIMAGSAQAQGSPPPIGFWTTVNGGERLLVEPNGQCSFAAPPSTFVGGTCYWEASQRGGILDITYRGVIGWQHVYFNILWINRGTISVEGDVFYRRQ